MRRMGQDEFDVLVDYVRGRYEASGQPAEVVKALDEHNTRVLDHVNEIAKGEGLGSEEHELLKTIAILHDVAKADTHLMLHADVGAEVAAEQLRSLGKEEAFIEEVQSGIVCHMGPFPFIEEEAEKYAARTGEHVHHPRPQTKIEKLFYDADMLALMDIEGIEKVVVLRYTTPQFIEEDELEARDAGGSVRAAAYRSALQSVHRSAATLHSETARCIGQRLMDEAERHVSQRLASEDANAP